MNHARAITIVRARARRLFLLAPLIACDAPSDASDGEDAAIEFRDVDLQCLAPTAPTASTPVVADVVPGEQIRFQGAIYTVPGAPADIDGLLDDPQAATSLRIGDVVRVVHPMGNYRSKMVGSESAGRMRTVKQGSLGSTTWDASPALEIYHSCFDDVAAAQAACTHHSGDEDCCENFAADMVENCLEYFGYDVPAGRFWLCGDNFVSPWGSADIEVGALDCTFTGTGTAGVVDISNGFLTSCSASASTPVGCQSF